MESNIVTKQIPLEKLHEFQLKIAGDKISAEQLIIINGLKIATETGDDSMGNGIGTIELILAPAEKPKLSITYHKKQIEKEVADCLGLEKVYR